MRSRTERGFTLVEMMMVVAIIGILAAIAIPSLRNTADSESTARNIASLIGEAARTAVGRGPVPAEVIANSLKDERIEVTISGTNPTFIEVKLQVETSDTTSDWYTISRTPLPRGIEVLGAVNAADLDGGDSPFTQTPATPIELDCFSNGRCDAKTIYLKRTDSANDLYRVVVMPLSTAPQVLRGR